MEKLRMRYVGAGTVMIFALFSFKSLCLQGDAKKGMDRVGFETSLKSIETANPVGNADSSYLFGVIGIQNYHADRDLYDVENPQLNSIGYKALICL